MKNIIHRFATWLAAITAPPPDPKLVEELRRYEQASWWYNEGCKAFDEYLAEFGAMNYDAADEAYKRNRYCHQRRKAELSGKYVPK